MPAAKIVVVDDEIDAITFCKIILSSKYEVVAETDATKAYKTILENKPDMVIMDLRMPIVDGFKLFDRMKENRETAKLPIIIMTASTRNDDLPDPFWQKTIGCDAFLTKPFEPYQLLQAVERVFEKKIRKKEIQGGGYL